MKNLSTKFLLLFCLLAATGLAQADYDFDARHGFPDIASLQWRLGSFRGGNRGYEILYKAPGSHRWHSTPGAAVAVGDGWVLGTDRHRGGYGIYRWNGYDWSRMPGEAVRIGGSYRQPWVINDYGIRFVWNGYQWRETGLVNRNDKGRNQDHKRRRDHGRDSRNDQRDSYRRDQREDSREQDGARKWRP